MGLDPPSDSGQTEDAHESACGLRVVHRDGSLLFVPSPEPLDGIAIVVDSVPTGERCLMHLGHDRGPRSQLQTCLRKALLVSPRLTTLGLLLAVGCPEEGWLAALLALDLERCGRQVYGPTHWRARKP